MASIFANLPNDIIINIITTRRDLKQKERQEREQREEEERKTKYYKGKFSLVMLHLEAYAEEWDDNINGILGNGGDIRCDLAFIDNNELWNTPEYMAILDKQGPNFDPNDYY